MSQHWMYTRGDDVVLSSVVAAAIL